MTATSNAHRELTTYDALVVEGFLIIFVTLCLVLHGKSRSIRIL